MAASGIESDGGTDIEAMADRAPELTLGQGPWLLTQVTLLDQSDEHSELLWERKWLLHPSERRLEVQGNLFAVENTLTGAGRIFVKHAPLPHARESASPFDYKVHSNNGGFRIELAEAELWSHVEYSGGAVGRAFAFQAWQRSQRPGTSGHRLPKLLCNTWGDRSRDSRIQEAFIIQEIEAATRLGAEVVQIDDGWQKGRTSNSAEAQRKGGVWEGFWNGDPAFWTPDPERFPNGLAPVVEAAKKAGIEIGLWFAPDSWNDFENWRLDLTKLLELHGTLGIRHFKIDGVNARTKLAMKRVQELFKALREESKGEIVIDMDITAQLRPGHFGTMDAGPLFVENRYSDWRNYWPHHTLRALWQLARWIDPLRLRMEFLNNNRNKDKYQGDPLGPVNYRPDALFATVMLSNPLGWFEISNLSEDYLQKAAPLVKLWKSLREELFKGAIIPIGAEPDGVSWTGFVSLEPGLKRGFILLFRELSEDAETVMKIPGLEGSAKWELLAGEGALSSHGNALKAKVDDKLGYVFGRFEAKREIQPGFSAPSYVEAVEESMNPA